MINRLEIKRIPRFVKEKDRCRNEFFTDREIGIVSDHTTL